MIDLISLVGSCFLSHTKPQTNKIKNCNRTIIIFKEEQEANYKLRIMFHIKELFLAFKK